MAAVDAVPAVPGDLATARIALAHDYATQRGGAERVALTMAQAFPGAPMYTSLYDSDGTFPEFAGLDLRLSALDRVGMLRRDHRLALPLLGPAVSAQRVEADVLLASSSGWAHGYRGARRTVVYCHIPARWLYQRHRYLGPAGSGLGGRVRAATAGAALSLLSPSLRRWDGRAARRADVYLANSTVAQRAIQEEYGIEAEILPPPPSLLPVGEEQAIPGLQPGFLLCVARLMPYKNVDVVIEAAKQLGGPELVVVGDGPDRGRLETIAARGTRSAVHLVGRVSDAQLRWLYRSSGALVAASYEDFGLSPLEAAAFGKPAAVLRDGGYLDTVIEGSTGEFFDAPEPEQVADAAARTLTRTWDRAHLVSHAERFAAPRFIDRLHDVVRGQLSISP